MCPACNYELSGSHDYCENCGAPVYLAIAVQATEFNHCTYCGAREIEGSALCQSCGLKKNFRTSETGIGTCRNCGVLWRNTWLYCRTCGVARENGLVDSTTPIPVNFSPAQVSSVSAATTQHYRHDPGGEIAEPPDAWFAAQEADSFSTTHSFERDENLFLSENEVVEKMFANGDFDTSFGEMKKAQNAFYLSPSDSDYPSDLEAPSVVDDLADPPTSGKDLEAKTHEPESAPTENVSAPISKPETRVESPAEENISSPTLTQTTDPETPLLLPQVESKLASSPLIGEAKSTIAPVQTVRFISKPRGGAPPPLDKKLINLIALLIGLILLFSALIVSGVKIQDLFHKSAFRPANSQALTDTKPTPAPTSSGNNIKAPEGMVYIPAGVFKMGVENGDSYESPAHEVKVAPFFMDRTEVTNEQYEAFVKAVSHPAPADWQGGKYAKGAGKMPVVNVSWQDANEYAKWAEKRLPTEAEWEFAARSTDGRRYPWGAEWNDALANTSESKLNHPVEAGSNINSVSPFGVFDLTGNVWEWTANDVISYSDPNITLAPGKVIRGGAFYAPKERATTTYRGFAPPDTGKPGIGFRCVVDVK